ncbi:MAG: ABC transporter permease [Phycisphaerales bacterium]
MTFLIETIRLGLHNLRLHMLRSILTALGIILGVAAVITMVSVGEGSKREALLQIERLGARNIIIRSIKPPDASNNAAGQQRSFISRYGISRSDFDVLEEQFGDAEAIVPVKAVGSEILRGALRTVSQAYGTTPELADVANLRVSRGRYLAPGDLADGAMVCVLGSKVAEHFFPFDDPLGQNLRIDDKSLTVIGVLAPVGLSGGAGAALIGRDLNLDVHIPFTTARLAFGDIVQRRESGSFSSSEVQVEEVYLQVRDRERVGLDAQRVRRTMAVRHPALEDIQIIVPFELLEQARRVALTWNLVLGFIAGISLLVGGIGIMNIMLASVTERTREIGIRRAVGATRKHILAQFLVETSVLSAIGGLVGVGLGVGVSVGIPLLMPVLAATPVIDQWVSAEFALPTQVTLWSILLSFGVATVIGLVFGIYPAIQASKQDPIVALRHD